MRVAGLGAIIGVELALPHARMLAAGIDPETAEDLLAACEKGFVAAMNERDDGK